MRKILRTTKLFEIVQITCKRKDKLTDHLPDEEEPTTGGGIFKHEWLENFKD